MDKYIRFVDVLKRYCNKLKKINVRIPDSDHKFIFVVKCIVLMVLLKYIFYINKYIFVIFACICAFSYWFFIIIEVLNNLNKISSFFKAYLSVMFCTSIMTVFFDMILQFLLHKSCVVQLSIFNFGIIWIFLSLVAEKNLSLFVNEVLFTSVTLLFTIVTYIITVLKNKNIQLEILHKILPLNDLLSEFEILLLIFIPHMIILLLSNLLLKIYNYAIENENNS